MSPTRLEFTFAFEADQGARSYQEDSVQVRRLNGSAKERTNPVLAVLADGMGGHVGGEKASQVAIARYVDNFASGHGAVAQLLEHSLVASNDGISSEIRRNPALNGMGCTLVAAYIDQDGLRWASVGDSALLVYRGKMGRLHRLNEDHSIGALLDKQAEANLISFEDAKNDPRRRTLRSALTGGPIATQEIVSEPAELLHGDWVIVASDGLETLSGDEIAQIVGRYRDSGEPSQVVRDLLAEVRKKAVPHQDNVSIVAIKVVDPHDAETVIRTKKQGSEPVLDTVPLSPESAAPVLAETKASSNGTEANAPAPRKTGSVTKILVGLIAVGFVTVAAVALSGKFTRDVATTGTASNGAARDASGSASGSDVGNGRPQRKKFWQVQETAKRIQRGSQQATKSVRESGDK